jgi:hypothetical protein
MLAMGDGDLQARGDWEFLFVSMIQPFSFNLLGPDDFTADLAIHIAILPVAIFALIPAPIVLIRLQGINKPLSNARKRRKESHEGEGANAANCAKQPDIQPFSQATGHSRDPDIVCHDRCGGRSAGFFQLVQNDYCRPAQRNPEVISDIYPGTGASSDNAQEFGMSAPGSDISRPIRQRLSLETTGVVQAADLPSLRSLSSTSKEQ